MELEQSLRTQPLPKTRSSIGMQVTDIRKLDDKRFCLYIDYEPYSSVYPSDIRRLRLEVGGYVDDEKLETFRKEYLFKRAMNKAVSSIKFSDKCEYDIRRKLEELYYDREIVDTTIEKLVAYGYLDDCRYARGYIRRHIGKKGIGVIRYELGMKRVDADVIAEAERELEAELPDETDVIKSILTKKYSCAELHDKQNRIFTYMYSKGFNTKKVSSCIDELLESGEVC